MKITQQNNIRLLYNESIKWDIIIIYSILFLIMPSFLGLLFIIFYTLSNKSANKTDYYAFFICIAIYFSCINATKSPGGDQINYAWAYLNVPTQGFIGSLKNIYGYKVAMGEEGASSISGEFMNGMYNFIGYYITFGHYPLFAAIITFFDYFLVFLGLYHFCQSLRKPHIPIVCGVLILSFFYLYFNFTLHIQKQFLAQAIMMYVFGKYARTGIMTKKLWTITAISVFTHQSVLFFLPFLFIKQLHGTLSRSNIIFVSLLAILLIILGPSLAGNFVSDNSNSVLTYGLTRLAEAEYQADLASNAGGNAIRIFVIAFPIAYITIFQLWRNYKKLNSAQAFILNLVLFLLIAWVGMFKQPVSQYRYFMMLYAFMPFIYSLCSINTSKRDTILQGLSFLMIVWFYFQFEKIIWNYAPEIDIIIKSPIMLLFGNYYQL